jgi:hypothetical protein
VSSAEPVLRLLLPRLSSPALARLEREFPGAVLGSGILDVPLADRAPEEVLALCLRCGVTPRGSRVLGDDGRLTPLRAPA